MMRPWMRFSEATMNRRTAVGALAVAAILGLGGCASDPVYIVEPYEYAETPVWQVRAGEIRVVEAPGLAAPDPAIAARLAEPPAKTAGRWTAARLRTESDSLGSVVFTIEEASASERILRTRGGVTGLVTRDPESELTVAYAVDVQAYGPDGGRLGGAKAQSSASSTLREGQDEDDRRRLWTRLVKEATDRLDKELQRQVATGLAPVLQQQR